MSKLEAIRESNIELCRIICMLLIIAHHSVIHGGAINMDICLNKYIAFFLVPGGKICFVTFMVISTWFLVDRQFKWTRFVRTWLQVLFYSVTFTIIVALMGNSFSWNNWFSVFFPITGNSHGFAATYLAFYLLVPFLSIISKNINKKQLVFLVIILFYFEVISKILYNINNYYPPILSSELMLFILFYFSSLYLKKYPASILKNKKIVFSVFCGVWLSVFGIWCMSISSFAQSPTYLFLTSLANDEFSILYIAGGYALFFLFKAMQIPLNKFINRVAHASFGVLLFHDHNFFRYPLWNELLKASDWWYNEKFVLWIIICTVGIYFFGFLIDLFRENFADKICNYLNFKKIINYLENKIPLDVENVACLTESVKPPRYGEGLFIKIKKCMLKKTEDILTNTRFIEDEYKNCHINLIIIFLISLFAGLVFNKYIFQNVLFFPPLGSDLIRANLPVYILLFDNISSGGGFWSWSMGIGTSIFTHADVYFDPFTYILFIAGRESIANMMIWTFVIKLICESLSFSYYIRYFRLNKFAIIVSSMLYAFSGYSMIMGSNLALGTIMVYFPLLLLAIERYLDRRQSRFLLLMLFLICIYSYYYFYISGILSAGYLLIRSIHKKKKCFKELIYFGTYGMIALLLGAVILLPQLYLTLESSRVNGGKDVVWGTALLYPDIKSFLTVFARSFNLNVFGTGIETNYYGWKGDFFQREIYVTSVSILAFFQYLHFEKSKRKRIIFITFLLGGMVLVPAVSYALNAFATINYRWMYIIHLFICVMIGQSINTIIKQKKVDLKTLIISQFIAENILICTVTLILFADHIGMVKAFQLILKNKEYFILVLGMYFFILCISIIYNRWGNKTLIKYILCIALLSSFFCEIYVNYYKWYSTNMSVYKFEDNSKYGYDDNSNLAINKILNNDPNFYRIYKDFDSVYDTNGIPSDNDAMVQHYYGLKNYSSINNANYITFLQTNGVYVACYPMIDGFKKLHIEPEDIKGPDLNYINGIDDKYSLLDYLGVKYYLNKYTVNKNIPDHFEYIFTEGDVDVYENKKFYPLAFVNNKYMKYEDFRMLSHDERIKALLEYTIINDDAFILQKNIEKFEEQSHSLCEIKSFSADKIIFDVNIESGEQYVSFSIPYDDGWEIYVDGKKTNAKKINIALLGAKISQGQHFVEIRYIPKGFVAGISISGFVLVILMYSFFRGYVFTK